MLTVADQVTKVKVAAAASALAAAAVLTPAVAAHAQPITMPSIPASPLASMFGSDPIEGPVTLSTDTPWWWIGGHSPNSPNPQLVSLAPLAVSGTTIIDFQPLSLVPGFLQPIVGALTNLVPQFNVCVAGLGVSVGAYGRVTVKTSAC
jgi:hypothetical protein